MDRMEWIEATRKQQREREEFPMVKPATNRILFGSKILSRAGIVTDCTARTVYTVSAPRVSGAAGATEGRTRTVFRDSVLVDSFIYMYPDTSA